MVQVVSPGGGGGGGVCEKADWCTKSKADNKNKEDSFLMHLFCEGKYNAFPL